MPGDAVLEVGGKSMTEDIKQKSEIDSQNEYEIMTPEEVAQFLKKSTSWVYKNWQKLGGRKLRGSLFFPRKEELYERIFGKEQNMVEVRFCPEGEPIHTGRIQNKNRGKKSRGQKKGGNKQHKDRDDSNRHGLFGTS
jgi:hypothetical protein